MPSKSGPLALLLAALVALPLAAADEHGAYGPDDHVRVAAVVELDGETYYVVEDHGATQVWRETNGVLSGGVEHRFTREATGVQPANFCLLAEGAVHYQEAAPCAEGEFVESDARVTNGALLAAVHELADELVEEHAEPVHDLLGLH